MSSGGMDHLSDAVVPKPPSVEPTLPSSRAFPCEHCQKRFRSHGALQRHSNGHHPAFDRFPMQCRFCPFLTSKRREFFRHRREFHPDCSTVFYCCPQCNQMYRALGQYYDHCLVHMALSEHGGKDQQDMASIENLEVGLLEDSLDVVRDNGPTESARLADLTVENLVAETSTSSIEISTVAERSSASLESLIDKRPRSNERLVTSVAPPSTPNANQQQTYRCPYCPEKSQVPNWLQVHVYMCHGAVLPSALQVMCGHCDLVETDSAKLLVHQREHHSDLPVTYKCPTCGKFYHRLFFYEAHYKSHTIAQLVPKSIDQVPAKIASLSFTCPDCSTTCADLADYEAHLQEKHAEFSIAFNHSTLSTNDDLQQQSDSILTPNLQCSLCSRNFAEATKLVSHQEVCLLIRGMPSTDLVPVAEEPTAKQCDDVIPVRQAVHSCPSRASWYREVVIPESKVYSCAECDERFDSLALVELHTISKHCPENLSLLYKCTKCGEMFEGFATFQKHSLKHI